MSQQSEFFREVRPPFSPEACDKVKSDLYRDMLPLLNSGRITLPKSDRLVQQTHVRSIHLATSSIPLQSA
jgi:hypothetical protein